MAGFGNLNPDAEVNNNPAGGGGSVTILPDDIYELEAREGDVKPNSTGKGQNYDNKLYVVSGPYKDTWFFGGITSIQHESAQAQAIAQGTLKAMCLAADVDYSTLTDTSDLDFRPFHARVGQETYFSKKHNKDMTKNVIVKFMYDGMPDEDEAAAPPAAKSTPTPAPTPAPAATGSRPWAKK
jgi:hypothetical protein